MKLINYAKSAVSIVLLSSVLTSTAAYAKHSHHQGHSAQPGLHKMAKFLELTDEQKTKIKAIFEQSRADKRDNHQLIKDYRSALDELVSADNYSAEAVRALYLQYQDAFINKEISRAQFKHQINAVLTDEQRAKQAELHAKFKHHKRKGHKADKKAHPLN